MYLVHVAVLGNSNSIDVDIHGVLLLVLGLVAVNQAYAVPDLAVGVSAVGVFDEQANEEVDVARRYTGLRRVDDEHVHHFASVR